MSPNQTQPNLDLGRLSVEVSRSHTTRHTRPLGLLLTSDQLVSEAATYTTHDKHMRRSKWHLKVTPKL